MGSAELARGFLLWSTTRESPAGDPESFDTTALRGIHDVTVPEIGRLTCKLPVTQRVQNRNGHLHGGATATLIDVVGTAALLTMSPRPGVSLNINTNYLAAMPGGGVVLLDAKVLRKGRTIAFINVDLTDEASGNLVAQGTHIKFISPSEPDLSALVAKGRPRAKL